MTNILNANSTIKHSNLIREQSSFMPSPSEVVLSIDNVSKRFCRDLKRSLFYGIKDISSELLGLRNGDNNTLRKQEFWAVRNVSFELRKGEAVGLIGKNGSGKSTLLRMVSGLIKPDTGEITVKGRVAPLIALSAGFNPILTGRENIYANMSILGLTKQQIDDRFDAVVAFSEVESAIDAPVQSYSSGMAARLGFACAVHTGPDILVIDEVLSVGDVQFQSKCFRRLKELREQGVSFILVSHNSNSIRTICESAVYLSQGVVQATGDTAEVMKRYETDLLQLTPNAEVSEELILPARDKADSLGADITAVSFQDSEGNKLRQLSSGGFASLCISCTAHKPIKDLFCAVSIRAKASDVEQVLYMNNFVSETVLELSPGQNLIVLEMPYVGLLPGQYYANIRIGDGPIGFMDVVEYFDFSVESNTSLYKCRFNQSRHWKSLSI